MSSCRRLWALIEGLPPEAAFRRIKDQQWTLREELLALTVESVDRWGLVQAYLHSANREGLPEESRRITRPWVAEAETASGNRDEKAPKKDRYQKQRERAAFFGYAETA